MKINICYETKQHNKQDEVANSSFLNFIELLKEDKSVEVLINNKGKGDVMHSYTYGPYFLWRGLKYKDKKILSINNIPDSITGNIPASKPFKQLKKWYFKKAISFADVCLAINPTIEKEIKNLGVNTSVVRIDNPLNVDKWRRTSELRKKGREMLGIKEDEFCILGVGALDEKKDSEDFIEIGKQIPEAQFRWIGSRSSGISSNDFLKSYRYIHYTPANIQFPGKLPLADMPSIYAAGDIFLVPIFQKNYSMNPLEAAASGMPVIYRNIKEYNLLYNNDYMKANNNDQFVIQIEKLMANKEEYKRGVELSKQMVTQFDESEISKKLNNLYADLYDFAKGLSNN